MFAKKRMRLTSATFVPPVMFYAFINIISLKQGFIHGRYFFLVGWEREIALRGIVGQIMVQRKLPQQKE